jgi:hypothetical protein
VFGSAPARGGKSATVWIPLDSPAELLEADRELLGKRGCTDSLSPTAAARLIRRGAGGQNLQNLQRAAN